VLGRQRCLLPRGRRVAGVVDEFIVESELRRYLIKVVDEVELAGGRSRLAPGEQQLAVGRVFVDAGILAAFTTGGIFVSGLSRVTDDGRRSSDAFAHCCIAQSVRVSQLP
jgi:hypothetical protein